MKVIHLTPAAIVFVQLGALAVGMASWLDDDEDGGGSGGDDDLAMDDDDDFAMDDGDDFDDDFDDDFGSFDDMDGGGAAGAQDASANELEHRLEELETEVSNVASKAKTVRSENEQISESVEDVEENVRKLLEIYEMVTRGVNPFVDEVDADAVGGGGQSFGLFDDDDGDGDEPAEELDEDIATADPNDFFEDDAFDDEVDGGDDDLGEFDDDPAADLDDEVGEPVDDFDEFADDDPGTAEQADDEFGDLDAEDGDESDDSGGGTSFEELKQEYESGEADWANGDDGAGDAGEDAIVDDEGELADEDETSGLEFDDSDLVDDEASAAADDESESELDTGDFQFGAVPADESSDGEVANGAQLAPSFGMTSRSDGPHLAEPPSGYLADVVALEWLDYLLSEFGAKNTVRTLNYYERIGWIGEPVRDQLFDYMEGLTDSDYLYRDEFGSTDLTMDDHMHSLDYIDELASENIERAIVDRFDDLHRNGIQR